MRIFLGILARRRLDMHALSGHVDDMARATLPSRALPYRSMTWLAPSARLALLAWDNEPTDDDPLVDVDARGVSARARGGYGHMVATGDASWVTADDATGSITAATGLSRLAPVYWARTPDAWLVSGRALLLARLSTRDGLPQYDLPSLVGLVLDGYLRDDRTPYVGVGLVGAGGTLTIAGDTVRTTSLDPAELRCGTLMPEERDLDELASRLHHGATSSAVGDVVCDVTGGRDSRLVAATLHAAGIPFRARTRGAPDHPDVVVAARVARALGVPHERVALPKAVRADGGTIEVDLAARVRSVLFASDGMLIGWENALGDPREPGDGTIFGGGGGETLRGGFAKKVADDLDPTWEDAAAYLWSRHDRFGRLFRPGATDTYASAIRGWIDTERAAGVTAGVSLDRFYVWYRTGRWKAAFQAAGHLGATRHPLLDDPVTRFGLRLTLAAKASHQIAQGLAVRLAPALRDVPYAEIAHRSDELADIAADDGGDHASKVAPPFDWRRTTTDQMFGAFRDQVFEGSGSRTLFALLDRDRLGRWFDRQAGRPAPAFARTPRFMWGLYSCGVLLSNDWLDPGRGPSQVVRVRVPPGTMIDDDHGGDT